MKTWKLTTRIINRLEFNPHDTVAEDDHLQKAGPLNMVVDDREQNSGVIEHLQAQESIRVTVRRLEWGDYLVNQRVLIERKTVADLSVSIVDGRLFRQACLLAESPYRSLLVIEGHVDGESVPAVKRVRCEIDGGKLLVTHLPPCGILFTIQPTGDRKTFGGCGIGDQSNNSFVIYKGFTAPV